MVIHFLISRRNDAQNRGAAPDNGALIGLWRLKVPNKGELSKRRNYFCDCDDPYDRFG